MNPRQKVIVIRLMGEAGRVGPRSPHEVESHIASFAEDAAYDTVAIYEAAAAHGARVVVAPLQGKTAIRIRGSVTKESRVERTTTPATSLGERLKLLANM